MPIWKLIFWSRVLRLSVPPGKGMSSLRTQTHFRLSLVRRNQWQPEIRLCSQATDCHMFLRMILEIKVSRDRLRWVFVVFLYVTEVLLIFSESVASSSPYFADVWLFAKTASYTIDDNCWGRGKMISDLDGSLGSRYLLNATNERTCFASCACAFKSSGLITCLEKCN